MFIPDIRCVYSHPWRDGRPANPGKIPTCIQVAVRPETTVRALETMFRALSQFSTTRAHPAGVGRVDVLNRDARSFRLVLNKGLKLSPCPAVESGAYPLTGFNPVANVRQILHRDFGDAGLDGGLNDGFARFVVDVLHTSHLFTGDLPELLFCALAAVGLKTATQGKVTVALITQVLAAEDLAQAMGGEVVFSNIHAHHKAGCHGFRVVTLDNKVEIPASFAKDEFGLSRLPADQDAPLVFTQAQGNTDTPFNGVERHGITFERIGAFVEMHAGAVEANFWNRLIFPDTPEFLLCLVRLAYREDGVAAHLAAQRRCLTQRAVSSLVQRYAIPDTMLSNDRNKPVAGVSVGSTKRSESTCLFHRDIQPDRRCAHHRLSPLGDMFGTLDVAADGFGADVARRADVIRRRPQVFVPQTFLERWKPLEQTTCRDALEHLDGIGYGDGGRDAQKQVDVIRLNLLGDHRPATFCTNHIQHRSRFLRHLAGQHSAPILRAPNHMVGCLVDAISIRDDINHAPQFTPHGALRATTIPPAIEIAGFLAEVL